MFFFSLAFLRMLRMRSTACALESSFLFARLCACTSSCARSPSVEGLAAAARMVSSKTASGARRLRGASAGVRTGQVSLEGGREGVQQSRQAIPKRDGLSSEGFGSARSAFSNPSLLCNKQCNERILTHNDGHGY